MIKAQATIKEIADDIAMQLGESAAGPKFIVLRIVRTAGADRATALLQEALKIEAEGGMMLPDNSRYRTVGGIFFHRAKQELTPQQRHAVWGDLGQRKPQKTQPLPPKNLGNSRVIPRKDKKPPKPVPAFTWEDRIEAVREAESEKGKISVVKITVVGKIGQVVDRGSCVVTVMEESKTPALPKGLPSVSSKPVKYAVYIAAKQWAKVKDALADPEDVLIAEGFPKTDPEVSAIAVFCTQCTTKKLQSAQRAEKKTP